MPRLGESPFLFVFANRRMARHYTKTVIADRIRDGQVFRIQRCEVKNLRPPTLKYYLPDGTMFADAVKVI